MENTTRISDSSLNEVLHHSGGTIYSGDWDTSIIEQVVTGDHLFQVMHQCAVLGVNTAVYACASETGLLYTVSMYMSGSDILVNPELRKMNSEHVYYGHILLDGEFRP